MARCPAITLTATNSSLEEPRRGSGIGLELRRGVTKPYTALSRRYPGIDGPYWSDARKRGSASTFYREVLMSVKPEIWTRSSAPGDTALFVAQDATGAGSRWYAQAAVSRS